MDTRRQSENQLPQYNLVKTRNRQTRPGEEDCGTRRLWNKKTVVQEDCGTRRLWNKKTVEQEDCGTKSSRWPKTQKAGIGALQPYGP